MCYMLFITHDIKFLFIWVHDYLCGVPVLQSNGLGKLRIDIEPWSRGPLKG
jgi:hypothetical protein